MLDDSWKSLFCLNNGRIGKITLKVAKVLSEEIDVNILHRQGYYGYRTGATILHSVIIRDCDNLEDKLELMRFLLNVGANVNIGDETCGESPLYWAVHLSSDEEFFGVAKLLLDYGADINLSTKKYNNIFDAIKGADVENKTARIEFIRSCEERRKPRALIDAFFDLARKDINETTLSRLISLKTTLEKEGILEGCFNSDWSSPEKDVDVEGGGLRRVSPLIAAAHSNYNKYTIEVIKYLLTIELDVGNVLRTDKFDNDVLHTVINQIPHADTHEKRDVLFKIVNLLVNLKKFPLTDGEYKDIVLYYIHDSFSRLQRIYKSIFEIIETLDFIERRKDKPAEVGLKMRAEEEKRKVFEEHGKLKLAFQVLELIIDPVHNATLDNN